LATDLAFTYTDGTIIKDRYVWDDNGNLAGLSERMPDDLVRQAFLNAWSASPVPPGVVNPLNRVQSFLETAVAAIVF
jgi:hypothetical protein